MSGDGGVHPGTDSAVVAAVARLNSPQVISRSAQGNPVRILLAVTVYGDIDNVPPAGGQGFKPEPSAGQDIVGVERHG